VSTNPVGGKISQRDLDKTNRPVVNHHVAREIKLESQALVESCFLAANPNLSSSASQLEWSPFRLPTPGTAVDFVDGLRTIGGSGDPNLRDGFALHIFTINRPMDHRAFLNADGECMFIAQHGNIDIKTEFGRIYLQPGEIAVIPRGVKYTLDPANGSADARGYIIELFGTRWELPNLGPIGSQGLANPRDFLVPVAYVDDNLREPWQIVIKLSGKLHSVEQDHSPFDVAAWHGNCVPYKVREDDTHLFGSLPSPPFKGNTNYTYYTSTI